ncbi:MAG: Mini-ribonuclease 3 [Clostridia bacterium]|nr:Mini-ribonuclease 3 [Clostridia bacterium]
MQEQRIVGANLPSGAVLAYLGDAWYSLYVRRLLIDAGIEKPGQLNEAALSFVTAKKQAERMRRLLPYLTEDEAGVFRRAANASHPHRPKGATATDYRYATGFEALIGMLYYLKDEERLLCLMKEAHKEENINDSEN